MDESYYLRHILKSKTIDIDPELESFTLISDHINHEHLGLGVKRISVKQRGQKLSVTLIIMMN